MIKNTVSNGNNVLRKGNNSSWFGRKPKELVSETPSHVGVIGRTRKHSYLVSALTSSFPGELGKADISKEIR